MSATEELLDTGYPNALRPELHKALKARGIDYWVAQGITFWNRDDGCECLAYGYKANGVPTLAVKVVGFTDPEQAIAATLGPGTCTVECFDDGIDEALDGSPIYTTPTWYLSCGHTCVGAERPSFCPDCGRRCVG